MTLREKLEQWYVLKDQLKQISEQEMALRKELVASYFPERVEGTNTVDLGDGFALKAQHKLNRKVDLGTLSAMRDRLTQNRIKVDALVEYKPSLVLREYRQLTEEERQLFDSCLIISEGSPTLEVAAVKKKKES